MEHDWYQKKTIIQIRQIVQMGDSYAITFSPEMLAHLKVSAGENVQVVMIDNDLVIRKIVQTNDLDDDSTSLQNILHETGEKYKSTVKVD